MTAPHPVLLRGPAAPDQPAHTSRDPSRVGPCGPRPLRCRACERVLAAEQDRTGLPDGRPTAAFSNPHGYVYELLAVRRAPGTIAVTPPTTATTWFSGHAWQVALCRGCELHVGWVFTPLAPGTPGFVALITDRVAGG